MNSLEVSYLSGEYGYTAKIKDALDRARHEFIFIGLLLTEVQNFEYYKEECWNDVYEYCESHFGFKRSSTNNFLRVYRAFGEQMTVKEPYRNYSYSQLTEMCSMNNNQLKQCSPDMTVKELRDLKKSKPVQTSGQTNYLSRNDEILSRELKLPGWLATKISYLIDGDCDQVLINLLDYGVSVFGHVSSGYFNTRLIGNEHLFRSVDGSLLLDGKLYIHHESEAVS